MAFSIISFKSIEPIIIDETYFTIKLQLFTAEGDANGNFAPKIIDLSESVHNCSSTESFKEK